MNCYVCEDTRFERFGSGEDRPCSSCNRLELAEYEAAVARLRPRPSGTVTAHQPLKPYRGYAITRVHTNPPPPEARHWYVVDGRPFTMLRLARAYVDAIYDRADTRRVIGRVR